MRNYKEKVYNSIYGHEKSSYESPYGFVAFVYKILKKREVNRYQVAYDLLPSIRDGRLLDVGYGNGDLIFICRSKFRECYGVDISLARVERAKRHALEKHIDCLYFYEYDVDKGLPFSDSFFDAVTCIAVLEHVFNPPNVVNEIHRVLKPDGFLLCRFRMLPGFPIEFSCYSENCQRLVEYTWVQIGNTYIGSLRMYSLNCF